MYGPDQPPVGGGHGARDRPRGATSEPMARRVNKKFLIVLTVILLGGLSAGVVVAWQLKGKLRGERARKMAEQADTLVKEAESEKDSTAQAKKEKLDAAARNYLYALGADPKNVDLHVKLGDVYTLLSQYDVNQYIRASRKEWETALENNPTHLPALRRLMDSYRDEVQMTPVVGYFQQLQDKATQIAKLDPSDRKARSLQYIAPIHQWLANIETPAATIEGAEQGLEALWKEDPKHKENADIVFYAAAAKVQRGKEHKRQGRDAEAKELFKQAIQSFQQALAQQDDNADLHFRFYELLSVVRYEDREQDQNMRYSQLRQEELEKARNQIKPADASFVKINIAAFQYAMSLNQKQRAEAILEDLYAQKPNDQRVRLALAKLWRTIPAKRQGAIDLLKAPIVDIGFKGVEARRRLQMEGETMVELCGILIEDCAAIKESERGPKLKEIEGYYDKAAARWAETSAVLTLRGKIELLRGGPDAPVRAIQQFEKAQTQALAERQEENLDLTLLLARAYYAARQTGQARTQLLKYYNKRPDFIPVRMMLSELLIRDNEIDAAREHVNFLLNNAPDEPEVVRLAVLVQDPVKDKARIKELMAKIPEGTRAERLLKAQLALTNPVNDPAEALRCYLLVLGENAADFDALQNAQQILAGQGKKDEAVALLKKGQEANPQEERIGLLLMQLEGASSAEVIGKSEKILREQFKDPFQLALKMYEFKLVTGGRDEAFKHLQEAEKLKPADGSMLDLMFQHYLQVQDWGKAAHYADELGKINWDQVGGLIYRFRLAMVRNDTKQAVEHAREMTGKYREFARSWVFYGQALQAAGQFNDAVSMYQVALERQSNNPEALAGVVACYYQLGRPNDAKYFIDKGVSSNPNSPFFRNQLKVWEMNFGDPSKVLEQAKADRDANPKDVGRWIEYGRVQYAAARKREDKRTQYLADARATFTEAAKLFPEEKLVWAHLAELADFAKDFEGGEAVLKQMAAVPKFKDVPDPALMLADHYLKFGKPEQAEAVMKQAVVTFKGKDQGEVARRLAAYYTQNKRYDDALKLLDPSSEDKLVRQQIVEVYMLQGSQDPKSGGFAKAENLLRGLLQSKDGAKDAQLHALLGVVLSSQGREQPATEEFNTALELDPKNQAALYSRGQLRLKAKPPQLEEAIKDLVVLRDVNPGHVEARVALSEAFRLRNQLPEAARELEMALTRVPGRRDIRVTLAGIYAAQKPAQWGEVERLIRAAREMEPKELIWFRMEAKAKSAQNKHDEAAIKIREALANIPQAKDPREVEAVNLLRGEVVRDYLDILEAGKNWTQLELEVDELFKRAPELAKTGDWAYVKRATARTYRDKKTEAMADFMKAFDIALAAGEKGGNADVVYGIVDKIREHMGNEAAIGRASALATTQKGLQGLRWKSVLAYLCSLNKEQDRAAMLIEEVRSKKSEMPDIRDQISTLNVAGSIYMVAERYDQARAVYEELLAIKPDDIGALNNLACVHAEYLTPTNLPKALEYSGRAYDVLNKMNRQDPAILDTHGWVNVLSGGMNLDRGIDLLTSSVRAGEIPEAHYHLAEAYLIKKYPDQARKSLIRAQELIAERKGKTVLSDEKLQQRIDQAMLKAEKALSDTRAGAGAGAGAP